MAETAVSAAAVNIGAEPHADVYYTAEFAAGKDVTVTNANEWYDVTNEGTLQPEAEGFTWTVASGKLEPSRDLGDIELDVRVTLNATANAASTISAGLRRNPTASTTAPATGAQASTLYTNNAGVSPPATVRNLSFKTKILDAKSTDDFYLSVSSDQAGDTVKVRQFWIVARKIPRIEGTRA